MPNSSNAFAIKAWLEWLMRRIGGGAMAKQVNMIDPTQLPRVDAFTINGAKVLGKKIDNIIVGIVCYASFIDIDNSRIYVSSRDTNPYIVVADLDLNKLDTINTSETATALAVAQGKIVYRSSTGKIYIIDISSKSESQLADLGTPIESILKPTVLGTRMYVKDSLVYIDAWEPYLPVVSLSGTPQLQKLTLSNEKLWFPYTAFRNMMYPNYYYGDYIALLGVKANDDGSQVFAIRIINASDLSKVKDIDIVDPDTGNPVQAKQLNASRVATLGNYVAVVLNYSGGGADVYILKIDTGEVVKKYHYDVFANIATDGTYIYIVAMTSNGNKLVKVDPSTLTETQAQVTPTTIVLEYHNGYLYIMTSNGLTVLDTNLNTVTNISLSSTPGHTLIVGNKMYSISYSPSTNETTIDIVDLENNSVVATVTINTSKGTVVDIIPGDNYTTVKMVELPSNTNKMINGYYDIFGYMYGLTAQIKEISGTYNASETLMIPKMIGYLGDNKDKLEILYIYYRPLLRKPDGTRALQPAAPLIPRGIAPGGDYVYVYSLNGYLYKISGTSVQEEIDVLSKVIDNLTDETTITTIVPITNMNPNISPRDLGHLTDIALYDNKLFIARGSLTIIDLSSNELTRYHAMTWDIPFIGNLATKVSDNKLLYAIGVDTLIINAETNELLYEGSGPAASVPTAGGGTTVGGGGGGEKLVQLMSMIINDKLYTDVMGTFTVLPRSKLDTNPETVKASATTLIVEEEPGKVILARLQLVDVNNPTQVTIIDGDIVEKLNNLSTLPYTVMHKIVSGKLKIMVDFKGGGALIGRPILIVEQPQT